MERIFTSLLLFTVLTLNGGLTAAPIPGKEAITLILETLLQEAYAEPNQLALQKLNINAQKFGNPGFKEDEQFVNEEGQDDIVGNQNWPRSVVKMYLQQFIQHMQQQQKSAQLRAQEQYNFVHVQNLGGAMGYDGAKQYTGEEENALALVLQDFIQHSNNQRVVGPRGAG